MTCMQFSKATHYSIQDLDSSPPQPVTNVPVATGLDPATDDHLSTLLQDIDKSELGTQILLAIVCDTAFQIVL